MTKYKRWSGYFWLSEDEAQGEVEFRPFDRDAKMFIHYDIPSANLDPKRNDPNMVLYTIKVSRVFKDIK